MKLKKWQEDSLYTMIILAAVVAGVYLIEGPDADYVITDKKEGKITYRDLEADSVIHVMEFDADTAGIGFDVYSHVNVGDTIRGHKRTLKKPIAKPWYIRDGQLAAKTSAVRAINGVSLDIIKTNERRASMLRKMQQKQR